MLLATYVTPGTPRRVNLDANLSQERDGSTYYYMADGLGSIRNLIDSNEDTQNIYDYYAFGTELGSWTENVTNRYTYTAREYDTESGQYYYRARYYDGGGRFNRRDSLGYADGVNVYCFVRSAALANVDPYGLSAIVIAFGFDDYANSKITDDSGQLRATFLKQIGSHIDALKNLLVTCSNLLCCQEVHAAAASVNVAMVIDTEKKKGPPGDGPNKEYNLSLDDIRALVSEQIGLIDGQNAKSVTARVLLTDYKIYYEYQTNFNLARDYAAGATVPNEPKILMRLWSGPRTLAHELGHVAKYVGNDRKKVHSKDPENVMSNQAGPNPDCQWCTKVLNLAK